MDFIPLLFVCLVIVSIAFIYRLLKGKQAPVKPKQASLQLCKCENQKSWPSSRVINGVKVEASDLKFVASLMVVTQFKGALFIHAPF